VIAVVCLNPALDVTYHVDALVRGQSVRVSSVRERAGGKGVNVARVLAALGEPPCLLGFAGGRYASVLADVGLDACWTPIAGTTRRTVTVVDGEATLLLEPGPVVSDQEWRAFEASFDDVLASDPAVVVLAGSLPAGVPADAYGRLVERADTAGVRSVLDADGAALRAGVAAHPYLAKPNAGEARALGGGLCAGAAGGAGEFSGSLGDLVTGVLAAGARNAVVSCGADGLLAVLDGRRYRAYGPVVEGNPTGAGDALTAVLARGIATGAAWTDVLRQAIATAAAAAAAPAAGEFDARVADDLLPRVSVEEI
jgi:tagatose 6-phosphate kinase